MNLGQATKPESKGDKPSSQRSCYHLAEVRRGTKADSEGGVTSQLPKQGRYWIPELI
jgi:hypothetical protein